jgi:antitoxin component HigA of HigAB toxin-antitoxin module
LSRILNEQTNLTLETIARLEHELGTTLITFPEHKQKEGKSQELT